MRHLKRNLKTIILITALVVFLLQALATLLRPRDSTTKEGVTSIYSGIRESVTDDVRFSGTEYYSDGEDEAGGDPGSRQEQENDDRQKMNWEKHYQAVDKYNMTSNQSTSGAVHVLLSSYMRSGSTLMTSLLSGPDVFLVNEPLQLVTPWGYYKANNTWCNQRNTQCRHTSTTMQDPETVRARSFALLKEHPVDTARRVLQSIYGCQFQPGFQSLIADPDKMGAGDIEPTWGDFRACQGTHHNSEIRKACLPILSKTCQRAHARITKVIRLSVDTFDQLLREDLGLRVMHVFRDPVNIIASRLTRSKWYSLGPKTPYSIAENSQSLCDKMLADFHASLELHAKYPDRFMMTRYEDFKMNDSLELSKSVLNFMHLPNNTDLSHIEILNDAFRVYRKEQITKDILSEINQVCEEVIKKLGY